MRWRWLVWAGGNFFNPLTLDFAKPWYQFFNSLLQDSAYEMLPKPCFEVYLNNGAEDGYWDIEMYVAVQPKHH